MLPVSTLTFSLLLAPVLLMLTACDPPIQPKSRAFVVFVDQSLSANQLQTELWSRAADQLALQQLRSGDSLLLYGVHNATAEAAPLLDETIPPVREEDGMPGVLKARKKLAAVREAGAAEVRKALTTPTRSNGTRLLDAIHRLRPQRDSETTVVFLSDMLECSKELDLERTQLTEANLVAMAQAAAMRLRLSPASLNGVAIHCVLDSPAINSSRRTPNTRPMLERFWRLLFESAGAKLIGFDSRIS